MPAARGTTNSRRMPSTVSMKGSARPSAWAKKPTISGVSTMPSRLDRVALKIAAGTLPRASPVSATDDEMVDGNAHR